MAEVMVINEKSVFVTVSAFHVRGCYSQVITLKRECYYLCVTIISHVLGLAQKLLLNTN